MNPGGRLIILELILSALFPAGRHGDGQETAFAEINCHAADGNQLQAEQAQYPGPIALAEGHDCRRLLSREDARCNSSPG